MTYPSIRLTLAAAAAVGAFLTLPAIANARTQFEEERSARKGPFAESTQAEDGPDTDRRTMRERREARKAEASQSPSLRKKKADAGDAATSDIVEPAGKPVVDKQGTAGNGPASGAVIVR